MIEVRGQILFLIKITRTFFCYLCFSLEKILGIRIFISHKTIPFDSQVTSEFITSRFKEQILYITVLLVNFARFRGLK